MHTMYMHTMYMHIVYMHTMYMHTVYVHTVYVHTMYVHTMYMHTVYVHLVHSLSLQELCFGSSLHARSRRGVYSEWTAQGQAVNVSVTGNVCSLLTSKL